MGGDPADIRGFMAGTVRIKEGRLLKEGADREAILSTSTLDHINRWLEAEMKVDDILTINGVEFTIVGVMAYDLAGIEVSHRVLLTKEAVKEITNSDDVMLMLVRIDDLDRAFELEDQIEELLDQRHGVTGLTSAVVPERMLERVGMVSLIIQAVVVGIAFIALIVGCIGIVNILC
ncbi:ABC transporter permease [Thermodesulfovibrionales bacterium]|nr:ABC transporter permease [Thermodesulfovibrionales bacterium]